MARLINKKYYYFVSFQCWKNEEQWKACCEIIFKKPIRYWDDIDLMRDIAMRKLGVDGVVIENYILLRKGV